MVDLKKLFGVDNSKEFLRTLPHVSFLRFILKGIVGILLFICAIFIYFVAVYLIQGPYDEKIYENIQHLATLSLLAYTAIILFTLKVFYPSLQIFKNQLTSVKAKDILKHLLLIGIPLYILLYFWQLFYFLSNKGEIKKMMSFINDSTNSNEPTYLIIFALITWLMVGIGEEVFFRGGIYRALRSKMGMLLSLILSSALFSLVHFPGSIYLAIPTFLIGIISAWYLEYKNNLTTIIILHFLNDLIGAGFVAIAAAYSAKYILGI